jgi:acetylglutamate kinase
VSDDVTKRSASGMAKSAGPVVIKLGGEVIAGPQLDVVAGDVATLAKEHGVVVVHGGGPQATALQEALGQTPVKIAGRRVTDAATLDVMKMVLAGKLNVDLCAALVRAGASPVGLHGASSRVIAAEKRPPRVYSGGGDAPIDLGLVGDVTGVNAALIALLVREKYVPVLACLGAGADGQVYNINADIVANRVAVELSARGIALISDVPGVLRDIADPASRIPRITIAEGRRLIAEGVVTKGMIPKLEESFAAIEAGAARVHVTGRLGPGDLVREITDPGSVGTVLLP